MSVKRNKRREKPVYVALDVEAAGSRLSVHPLLSLGACVVVREELGFDEYFAKGLVFYAELKPDCFGCDTAAMRVGCSHLECLDVVRLHDRRYDPNSPRFKPSLVLDHMRVMCEEPRGATLKFVEWLRDVSAGREIIGVTDTVLFDGGRINLLFGTNLCSPSPLGWSGLDMDSLYRGYARRADAELRELGVRDERKKPHKADQDAVFLAQRGRKLLFDKMGW